MHYRYDTVGIGVICRNRVSRYERLRGIQRGVPRDQASVSEMRARPQTNNRATLGLCPQLASSAVPEAAAPLPADPVPAEC
jgi:hypothetical protein